MAYVASSAISGGGLAEGRKLPGSTLPAIWFTMLFCNACFADEALLDLTVRYRNLPEAILIPMKHNDQFLVGGGWVLSYVNKPTSPDVPEQELQSRRVTYSDSSNSQISASISWEIRRTRNNLCEGRGQTGCADMIRVLTVPDGFIAIPTEAWIGEGTALRLYIVPAELG